MFGLFKRKSKVELLQERYKKLLEEAYNLSRINRSASDEKHLEAEAVLVKINSEINKI